MQATANNKQFLMIIDQETKKLQQAVRSSGFIYRLITGQARALEYARYLFNQYFLFRTLETALEEHWSHPMVEPIYTPELYRQEALEHDMSVLMGSGWRTLRPLRATEVYEKRISRLADEYPEYLGAHAYTMYFARLKRSRSLYQIMNHVYGLQDKALNFYRYRLIDDMPEFIKSYQKAFDSLPLDQNKRYQYLGEINMSYMCNMAISLELNNSLTN
jgi:heme oxygenase